ncbi:hypothetical protein FQN53_003458 [Emmonsiellopsis sp. PD_33]|nr:hypothetical protein FQN53_003458 [Emmonsiellopsis sp. PD_33]
MLSITHMEEAADTFQQLMATSTPEQGEQFYDSKQGESQSSINLPPMNTTETPPTMSPNPASQGITVKAVAYYATR